MNTDALQDIHAEIDLAMLLNADAEEGARKGVIVDGDATVGKSTAVMSFGKSYEIGLRMEYPDFFGQRGNDYTPVVYLSIPSAATPKGLSLAIAEYFGLPISKTATAPQVTNKVFEVLAGCRTSLIIIDDVHFLDLSHSEGKYAIDHLKYLSNYCAATFVYAGIDCENSALFSDGGVSAARSKQTAGRFSMCKLEPFSYKTKEDKQEWGSVVKTIEACLRLVHHERGSLTREHTKYLYQRTGGSISSLSTLIRKASIKAILTGKEAIDLELLKSIRTDFTSQAAFDKKHGNG